MLAASLNPLAPFYREILEEAINICDGRPPSSLQTPKIAHLRGLIAARTGAMELAVPLLIRAIAQAPSCADAYSDLGDQLLRLGQGSAALGAHLQALKLQPRDPARYATLAGALTQRGLHSAAIAVIREGLKLSSHGPERSRFHTVLGYSLRAAGRLSEALDEYRTACKLVPDDPDAHSHLGEIYIDLGQYEQAVAAFRAAQSLNPAGADVEAGLGEALLHLGRPGEAVRAFQRALNASPTDVRAARHLVVALELLGCRDDAVGAWVTLGQGLAVQGRYDEATAALRQAIGHKPDCLRAQLSLARALMASGRAPEAVRSLQAAVNVSPQFRDAHVNLGVALHVVGETERGWDELAWHHDPTGANWRHVEQPLWDGYPLAGRTILLWADASASEVILHLRYAALAKLMGGVVVVQCAPELVPLARRTVGVDRVVADSQPTLPFDVHAPLLHLPSVVRSARSFDVGAAVPYVSAPADLVAHWRQRLRGNPDIRVGIAWTDPLEERRLGRRASLPLSIFAWLRDLDGVCVVNLQSRRNAGDHFVALRSCHGERAQAAYSSAGELAALLASLDLVICGDTSTTHLAGALGCCVWTLLPHGAWWPWPNTGDQTPWYPTMRLFRQQWPGDWRDVYAAVRTKLAAYARTATPWQ